MKDWNISKRDNPTLSLLEIPLDSFRRQAATPKLKVIKLRVEKALQKVLGDDS
jgi:hypothetical protein